MANDSTEVQTDFFGLANGDGVLREEAQPLLRDGTWGKAEALVFAQHLKRGDLSDALEIIGKLSNDGARAILCQAGFSPQATGGRQAMLASVEVDLIRAAQMKMTGNELRVAMATDGVAPAVTNRERVFPGSVAAPSFARALEGLQQVLSAPYVEVGVAGAATLGSRQSLQFIGSQAIERGISGFAIEGISGKFALPNSVGLAGLRELYGASAGAMAEAEVRRVLPGWASERGGARLSDLVPETMAKVLRGSATVAGAEDIRTALQDGSIQSYGATQGVRLAGQILQQQGVDINAIPVEDLAKEAGLQLVPNNLKRGQYVGPVVAQDHRASVIKSSREGALIVAHKDLPAGVGKPEKGDVIHVKFGADRMQISVQQGGLRQGVGR